MPADERRMPWPSWFFDAVEALELTSFDVAAFTVVWSHAKSDRIAWPSLRTIATKGGMARSTAQKAVAHLIETGILDVISAGGGRANSIHYRIAARMPRPRNVRFLPSPTRKAAQSEDSGDWLALP